MKEHHVVVLERCHGPVPEFDFPYTYTEYYNTKPHEIAERVREATIVIITVQHMTIEQADQATHLELVVVMGTGCGWVPRAYFAKRGVTVCNAPHSNIESCSGHALGLYFAVRRRFLDMHRLITTTDEWAIRGSLTPLWEGGPPFSCGQEIVGIIGHGALGQGIEKLCRGVGMGEIVIADRKGVSSENARSGRESFGKTIERATVLVICCPKDASTANLIDASELGAMRKDAILINMARGGIVNEQALARALQNRTIAGAATDVLEVEPGTRGQSPLLPLQGEIPNLTISPHVSWFAGQTLLSLQRLLKAAVEGYVHDKPVHVIVHPIQ